MITEPAIALDDKACHSPMVRMTAMMRKLGFFAVVFAAAIFMLQGFESVDIRIRHWTWTIMLCAMVIGGTVSRYWLDDVKSARIFLTLAVMVVPVQFSQLGGMTLELLAPHSSRLGEFWHVQNLGQWRTLIETLVSLVLGAGVAFMGFSVLSRPLAKTALEIFMALNVLMLLPFRGDVLAWVVLAAGLSILAFGQARLSQLTVADPASKNIVRGLLMVPFIILLVRNGMHVHTTIGASAIGNLVALSFLFPLRKWCRYHFLKELCVIIAALSFALSWWLLCADYFSVVSPVVWFYPLVAVVFGVSLFSQRFAPSYRIFASFGALVVGVATCVIEPAWQAALASVFMGLGMLLLGMFARYRWPFMIGAILFSLGLVTSTCIALADMSVNIWLTLAIGGVLLLLASSVVEKYGKALFIGLQSLREYE